MSTRWPYCTPLGQVLSQLRQVRQRSRCSCVLARRRLAFEHLLDQVDAAARAVELVAQQLVGRAGGGAEAAVHALAQDRLGLAAVGACSWNSGARSVCMRCMTVRREQSRPRLKMPAGSNCACSSRWMRSSGGAERIESGCGAASRRRSGYEQRSMTAGSAGRRAQLRGRLRRAPHAPSAGAPCHSMQRRFAAVSSTGAVCGTDRRHRSRAPRSANHGSRWSRQAPSRRRPARRPAARRRACAAGGLDRAPTRAAQAAASSVARRRLPHPAAGVERQRLAAPGVEQPQRLGLRAARTSAWPRPAPPAAP